GTALDPPKGFALWTPTKGLRPLDSHQRASPSGHPPGDASPGPLFWFFLGAALGPFPPWTPFFWALRWARFLERILGLFARVVDDAEALEEAVDGHVVFFVLAGGSCGLDDARRLVAAHEGRSRGRFGHAFGSSEDQLVELFACEDAHVSQLADPSGPQ